MSSLCVSLTLVYAIIHLLTLINLFKNNLDSDSLMACSIALAKIVLAFSLMLVRRCWMLESILSSDIFNQIQIEWVKDRSMTEIALILKHQILIFLVEWILILSCMNCNPEFSCRIDVLIQNLDVEVNWNSNHQCNSLVLLIRL